MPVKLPLILLPAMGADRRLFGAQAAALETLSTPDWIDPEPDDTLATYAQRMGRVVDPGGPCFVGGASFGGMVALEMSRHLEARACLLIGSIRSPEELPLRIRVLRPAAKIHPVWSWGVAGRLARIAPAVLGRFLPPAIRAMLEQFAEADDRFLKWASLAVLRWKPSPEPLSTPVLQIHGDRDWILPHRLTRPDVLVRGAGHLLPMTFPDAVNEFLRSQMERYAAHQI